jgi:hypothetical protein
MLIHEITKQTKIDEGLLSGIKNTISKAVQSTPLGQAYQTVKTGGIKALVDPHAQMINKQMAARNQALSAAKTLANRGYNIDIPNTIAAPLTVQQVALKSKLRNSPLNQYVDTINSADMANIQNLAKSFNPSAQPNVAAGMSQAGKQTPTSSASSTAKTESKLGKDANKIKR